MLLRPMKEQECWALLENQRLCVLSLVDGSEPYAVPVFYGLDGNSLILGLSEGRKTRAIASNPRVCITVTEVRDDGFWQSAQITGMAAVLIEADERDEAIRILTEHNRRLTRSPMTGKIAPRAAPGQIVRVRAATITGRAKENPA